MDFAALPPEVNSGRIYVGPGSGPMLAAAAAWDQLAASLHAAASAYQSEITSLTGGPWVGPAAESMSAAAAPYVAWMRTTAGLAEQAANQAKVAAAAYETAFAATVPPPVIAANRSLLATLVATNIFGQNTPAIATTETQYAEMWAQDAAAMYGYAGSAASATTLTPFTPPQPNSNSGADQPAAVSQATGTAAGNTQNVVSSTQQAFASVPNTLNSFASPAAAAADPPTGLDLLSDLIAVFLDAPASVAGLGIDSPGTLISLPFDVVGALTGFHTDDIVSGWAGVQSWPGYAPVPPTPFPVITNLGGGSVGGSAMTAGLGQANTVGGLSVPPGWAAAAPAIRPAALALPATSVGAAAQAAQATSGTGGNLFGEMAAAGMAGRAMGGTGGAGRAERVRATAENPKAKSTEKPSQDLAAPPQVLPGGPITSIAAELRELASLRDAGILTEAEFNEQKQRLLPH
ncbi:MAG: PPE domain-containing protein [Mycobacterium sp.]|uniref:PPE family protein, SVP subgroup n=1 Tax=Mycobacterium sp. TaxID=1785 RepID=UPI001EC23884|nr:PPE domain-containing protein [Mycobacterium sp.]MBV8789494.1 PPE domain-containing protein [Mycobacterium sp.]